jgi:hypothetical protein
MAVPVIHPLRVIVALEATVSLRQRLFEKAADGLRTRREIFVLATFIVDRLEHVPRKPKRHRLRIDTGAPSFVFRFLAF